MLRHLPCVSARIFFGRKNNFQANHHNLPLVFFTFWLTVKAGIDLGSFFDEANSKVMPSLPWREERIWHA